MASSSQKDPAILTKYDSALIGILQNEGALEPFLDVLFGFLFRKTDFYCSMKDPMQKFGFPEGVAEKLLMKNFHKYQLLTKKMEEQAEKNQSNKVAAKKDCESDGQKPASTVTQKAQSNSSTSPNKTEKDAQKPAAVEIPKDQEQFQSNPESYNGAVREKYSWSQNFDDVDVLVPVSKNIVKGNQVKVTIQRNHLLVAVRNEETKEMETIVEDDLKHEILREESMWSLEGGKNIQITLTKDTKFWWNSLLVHEEEIDVQKIAPERPMADMQQDEMAVINKLQFDEKQKRLGLPQSHELKVHDMLKKGWDVEGSPFKGQDFNPKMFNISPSGVQ